MSGAVNAIRKNTAAPTMPKIASSSNRPRSASSVTVGSKGHHGSGSGVGGSSSSAGGGAGGGGNGGGASSLAMKRQRRSSEATIQAR